MNPYEILATIVAAAGLIFGIAGILVPKLQKKGINSTMVLNKTDTILKTADKTVDAIRAIAPGIPHINEIDAVIEAADVATQRAEQLCKIGQLPADSRKPEAVEFVKQMLALEHVEITPNLENVIDGCCEAAVNALPTTHTDVYELPVQKMAPTTPAMTAAQRDKIVSGLAKEIVAENTPKTAQSDANSAPVNSNAGTGSAVPETPTAVTTDTPNPVQ